MFWGTPTGRGSLCVITLRTTRSSHYCNLRAKVKTYYISQLSFVI
jgi:hypothetical protein